MMAKINIYLMLLAFALTGNNCVYENLFNCEDGWGQHCPVENNEEQPPSDIQHTIATCEPLGVGANFAPNQAYEFEFDVDVEPGYARLRSINPDPFVAPPSPIDELYDGAWVSLTVPCNNINRNFAFDVLSKVDGQPWRDNWDYYWGREQIHPSFFTENFADCRDGLATADLVFTEARTYKIVIRNETEQNVPFYPIIMDVHQFQTPNTQVIREELPDNPEQANPIYFPERITSASVQGSLSEGIPECFAIHGTGTIHGTIPDESCDQGNSLLISVLNRQMEELFRGQAPCTEPTIISPIDLEENVIEGQDNIPKFVKVSILSEDGQFINARNPEGIAINTDYSLSISYPDLIRVPTPR